MIPGVGETKMVLLPRSASTRMQGAWGFIIPTTGMDTATGKKDVNMVMFDLERLLDLYSPDSAKASPKDKILDLYETINHELGHWLSLRYRQQAQTDPKTAKEYYAIQQDYAQWMLDNMKTPLGEHLYKSRGLRMAALLEKESGDREDAGNRSWPRRAGRAGLRY